MYRHVVEDTAYLPAFPQEMYSVALALRVHLLSSKESVHHQARLIASTLNLQLFRRSVSYVKSEKHLLQAKKQYDDTKTTHKITSK